MGGVVVHEPRSRGLLRGLRITIPMKGWVRISIWWRLIPRWQLASLVHSIHVRGVSIMLLSFRLLKCFVFSMNCLYKIFH